MIEMSTITYWHEWPSNFSNGTSVSGIGSFIQYGNDLLNGWLGLAIILMVFVISLVVSKNQSFEKAFGVATFINFLISILLMRIGMLDISWVIILGVMLAVAVLLARTERQQGL